jgi:hypothetical protein
MEEKVAADNSEELITHYSVISTYETICYVKILYSTFICQMMPYHF